MSLEELADRFSEIADQYDDIHDNDEKPIYNACASLVVEHANPGPDDVVLDLGTGTGLIALALAEVVRTMKCFCFLKPFSMPHQ